MHLVSPLRLYFRFAKILKFLMEKIRPPPSTNHHGLTGSWRPAVATPSHPASVERTITLIGSSLSKKYPFITFFLSFPQFFVLSPIKI